MEFVKIVWIIGKTKSYNTLIFGGFNLMKKYKCLLCGIEFESDEENPICPVCGASGDDVVLVEEEGK